MKFLGSFLFLGLLSLISVFAGPPPHEYITDSSFRYFIQYDGSNQAYIMDVLDKKASTIYIYPYVMHNDVQYDVVAMHSGLTGCAATKLVIPHWIYHSFSVWGGVLKEGKNLKELQINCLNDVIFYEDSFNGVNENLQIHGQGVDKAMSAFAKKLLQEHLPEVIKDYKKENFSSKTECLFKIAKYVKNNFRWVTDTESADNGASVLALKQGSSTGRARAIRILAIAAGYPEDEILTGGDGHYHGFNYVKVNSRKWKILDNFFTNFDGNVSSNIFSTSAQYISISNGWYGRLFKGNSDDFTVYNFKYGCPNEAPQDHSVPETENFKNWLSKNKK
eukprot:jgi/Orpsp1_1/1181973/evm.model.c7180000079345.1